MSEPPEEDVTAAGGALQTLIHQFADPLSFYRELVQNALDAGSLHVNIQVSYLEEEGRTLISVEDGGHGMTASVIDTQLTRLFASKKDGDLTRIGKFGIGFVSVFALNPERVVLDTACEGESWRVEFLAGGEFQRRRLNQVREGTLIRLYKKSSPEQFEKLRDDSRETILYWCKHVNGEILYNGEELNRSFTVDAPVVYRWKEPDTEIVMGYTTDGSSFTGFYNQGLTLHEEQGGRSWPGLAVKANSRFLEHTLTRDSILEDENFRKVHQRIQHMVENELAAHLFSELSQGKERETVFDALLSHFAWQTVRDWTPIDLAHETGEARGEGWLAHPSEHQGGFLCSGSPGLSGSPDCPDQAVFRFSIPPDAHTPGDTVVVECTAHDLEAEQNLGSRTLVWSDFRPRYGEQGFVLKFFMRPDQRVQFRVRWKGVVPVRFHGLRLRRAVTRSLPRNGDWWSLPLFRGPEGTEVTLSEMLEAADAGRLWFVPAGSTLSNALERAGHLLVRACPGTLEWSFLELLLGSEPRQAELEFVCPRTEDAEPQGWTELRPKLLELAGEFAGQVSHCELARPSTGDQWFALLLPEREGLYPYHQVAGPGPAAGKHLVLNSLHPLTAQLLRLAQKQPHLAAYLACKQFLSQTRVTPEMDARLAMRAWRMRRG